jgi:ferredoxin
MQMGRLLWSLEPWVLRMNRWSCEGCGYGEDVCNTAKVIIFAFGFEREYIGNGGKKNQTFKAYIFSVL